MPAQAVTPLRADDVLCVADSCLSRQPQHALALLNTLYSTDLIDAFIKGLDTEPLRRVLTVAGSSDAGVYVSSRARCTDHGCTVLVLSAGRRSAYCTTSPPINLRLW
jgi:hypothetical protein